MATKVGQITHFFDKISVGVLQLTDGDVKVGDTIMVGQEGEDSTFQQTITSMQVDHQAVESAKKGDEVGLKLDSATKSGTDVFLV